MTFQALLLKNCSVFLSMTYSWASRVLEITLFSEICDADVSAKSSLTKIWARHVQESHRWLKPVIPMSLAYLRWEAWIKQTMKFWKDRLYKGLKVQAIVWISLTFPDWNIIPQLPIFPRILGAAATLLAQDKIHIVCYLAMNAIHIQYFLHKKDPHIEIATQFSQYGFGIITHLTQSEILSP